MPFRLTPFRFHITFDVLDPTLIGKPAIRPFDHRGLKEPMKQNHPFRFATIDGGRWLETGETWANVSLHAALLVQSKSTM
jgi:hypothetical protein